METESPNALMSVTHISNHQNNHPNRDAAAGLWLTGSKNGRQLLLQLKISAEPLSSTFGCQTTDQCNRAVDQTGTQLWRGTLPSMAAWIQTLVQGKNRLVSPRHLCIVFAPTASERLINRRRR